MARSFDGRPKMAKTLYQLLNPNSMRIADLMSDDDDEGPITARTNIENRRVVIEHWKLGPEKTSVDPKANTAYWNDMATVWNVPAEEARRQLCANCEYFDNLPDRLAEMEAVPLDKFDQDGGGRGYCKKFDFICHSLRTCQAWECKPSHEED